MDHRGPRRRSGHRGRERSQIRARRPRSAARARRGRGAEEDGSRAAQAAQEARWAGQDPGGGGGGWTALIMSNRLLSICAAAVLVLGAGPASAQTRLLRFPDIHGDKVVFTYAGDLWTASVSVGIGGAATRLTAHPGLEQFARFSPDGKWIAFMGQYDGD